MGAAAALTVAVVLVAGCGGDTGGAASSTYRGGIPNDDYTQGEETLAPPAAPLKVGQPARLGGLQVTLDRFEPATGQDATAGDEPASWPRILAVFTAANTTGTPIDPSGISMTVTAGPDGIAGTYTFYDGPGGVGGIGALGQDPIRAGARRRAVWLMTVPAPTDIQVVMSGDDGAEVSWLGNAPTG